MTQPISRLAMLMQLLDITGREMAAALHVDHSLVSKWKNNHRKIPVRMGTIKRVADFLLESDTNNSKSIIFPLLVRSEKSDIRLSVLDDQTLADLRQRLIAWLQDQAPLNDKDQHQTHLKQYWRTQDQYVCPVEIFPGEIGRKKAVLNMFDTALSMPAGTPLWILIQENTSWVESDPLFAAKLRSKIIQLVDKKHELKIIHWLDHQSDMIHALARDWLPLQLNPHIQSWYYPKYEPTSMPLTIYIIPEHAALVGTSSEKKPSAMHSMILRDSSSIHNFQAIFETYLKKSLPLMQNHSGSKPKQLFHQLVKASNDLTNKNVYVQTACPSMMLLPKDILQNLNSDNQIQRIKSYFSDHTDHSLLETINEQTGKIKDNKCHLRHIYRLSSLIQASRQAETKDHFFSMISGKTVNIQQSNYRHILREMAHFLLSEDYYEIALLNDDQYQQVNWPNMVYISNNLFVAWGDHENQARLSASESTILHAFEKHFETRWQQIPLVCRDKKRVSDQLLVLCE